MQAKEALQNLARRYTAAWCSQDAVSVAAFYSLNGRLSVNDAMPAIGRDAIAAVAQGFMTAFPDMCVIMEDLEFQAREDRAVYRWILTGTNSGPGGTGQQIHIRGFEEWELDGDLLILNSKGRFDEAEYLHQLTYGLAG
jgi:hypothetical protein